MNKILLNCIFILIVTSTFSQNKQQFTRQFETSSGIYGYVTLSTKPTTVGAAYIWVQQDIIVVEGIRTSNQNFKGTSLADFGISFPYNCSNCYFYADGEASMLLNGTRYYGKFNKGGTINSGSIGKTNQPVNFSELAKKIHNQKQKELNYSLWEKTGQVESINIYSVKGADFGNVTRALDKYKRSKEKTEKLNNLLSQASNSSLSDKKRLSYLNQAKQYTQTGAEQNEVNDAIDKLNKEIEENRQQSNSIERNIIAQNIGSISAVSRKTSISNNEKRTIYDENGLPTTPEIEAIKVRSQAEYKRKSEQIEAIGNVVTGLINYFDERKRQRLEMERKQRAKEAREERRKDIFRNQANQYKYEYGKIINARKAFVNQPELKSTLNEDGTDFAPLYLYFAYVEKGYDYYYENISYPSTLDFRIRKDVDVQFSPVFAFFPYSNGQYPFIKDVKNKILNDHFGSKAESYEIILFQWVKSVDKVVSSLKYNLNKAVNNHYFTNAIPPSSKEIIFLTSKIEASNSKNHWTGKKVEEKIKRKIDYFNTERTRDTLTSQNVTMAEAFYKKALKNFEKKNYQDVIYNLSKAKENLNGETNPEIIYLEARTKEILLTNINPAKKLYKKFLQETEGLSDYRIDEVSQILVKLEGNFSYYNSGYKKVHDYWGDGSKFLYLDENGVLLKEKIYFKNDNNYSYYINYNKKDNTPYNLLYIAEVTRTEYYDKNEKIKSVDYYVDNVKRLKIIEGGKHIHLYNENEDFIQHYGLKNANYNNEIYNGFYSFNSFNSWKNNDYDVYFEAYDNVYIEDCYSQKLIEPIENHKNLKLGVVKKIKVGYTGHDDKDYYMYYFDENGVPMTKEYYKRTKLRESYSFNPNSKEWIKK